MPLVGNIYPNSGNQLKKVEIPSAACRISLPKQRKSAEKVEILGSAFGKSLPKRQKSAEKGRDSNFPRDKVYIMV